MGKREDAAGLAMTRLNHAARTKSIDEYFRFYSSDKDADVEATTEDFNEVATNICNYAHALLHETNDDHDEGDLVQAIFYAAFMFGRTFEELNVIELRESDNLIT